jgi:hypothetical protein
MRWKKLRLVLAGLVAACLLLWVRIVYWPDILTVSYADYCRVQPGMNRAEVDSIFGGSPSDLPAKSPIRNTDSFYWDGCAGFAYVTFDPGGKVVAKQYYPREDWDNADAAAKEQIRKEWRQIISQRRRGGAIDYVVSELRHQWHRWFP